MAFGVNQIYYGALPLASVPYPTTTQIPNCVEIIPHSIAGLGLTFKTIITTDFVGKVSTPLRLLSHSFEFF